MDAATLRIVLIVLGGLFLAGMYLWERHRARDDDDDWDEPADEGRSAKREPNLGRYDDDEERGVPPAGRDDDAWAAVGYDATGEVSPEPEQDTAAEGGPTEADALIVQLYVVAREGAFAGGDIMAAAERHNLDPGDMAIFHRRKVEGASRSAPFSMANAFNPGTFPFDAMEGFSTRGLVLFAQLDGLTSDLMVFDELVQAARDLADELDGELLDNDRQALGDEQIRRLRAEVLELLDGIAEPDQP